VARKEGALPRGHTATLDLPTYLGQLQREAEKSPGPIKSAASNKPVAPGSPRETAAPESRRTGFTTGSGDKNGLPDGRFAGLVLAQRFE
jgi:hypothetical protein